MLALHRAYPPQSAGQATYGWLSGWLHFSFLEISWCSLVILRTVSGGIASFRVTHVNFPGNRSRLPDFATEAVGDDAMAVQISKAGHAESLEKHRSLNLFKAPWP